MSVWTDRFPRDTFLDVFLADDALCLTLRLLLDRLFPQDAAGRAEVLARLDSVGNPDLPACYAELVELVGQWRAGLCKLSFYTGRGWGALAENRRAGCLAPARSGLWCGSGQWRW